MDRMRPRVASPFEHLLRFNDLVNLRFGRIWFRIDDVEARGPDPGDDQVAPLEECVAGEWRQGGRASVPAKMVKLVALVRHRHGVDDLAKGGRVRFDVDHRERVGL